MQIDGILAELAEWAAALRIEDVPYRVCQHAKNQVFSILGAIHSGYSSDLGPVIERCWRSRPLGPSTVIPSGEKTNAISAAMLMSGWSMVLDYDDVMLGGHTGHSSVIVPAAFACEEQLSGADFLVAQIVANEIAARINMTVALGPTRGQMATHLHLLAAAAALAKIRRYPAREFLETLALACSYPPRALYPGFLGSDAKCLCASLPIRCGIEAADAISAGVRGNLRNLEEMILGLSDAPQWDFLSGAGERWHTETNSYKTYPGSAYLQAPVEAAMNIARRNSVRPGHGASCAEIGSVDVFCNLLTAAMDRHSAPYLSGSESCLPTLTFSTRYAVASVLAFGDYAPEHLKSEYRRNSRVWTMAAKVRLHHDPRATMEALKGDIPIGLALRSASRLQRIRFLLNSRPAGSSRGSGAALRDKLRISRALCASAAQPLPDDFRDLEKPLGARVVITFKNGRRDEDFVRIPQGFSGSGDRNAPRSLMTAKFLQCASETIGAVATEEAADMVCNLDKLSPVQTRNLIRINSGMKRARARLHFSQGGEDVEYGPQPTRGADSQAGCPRQSEQSYCARAEYQRVDG